ncbi:putative defense protein 3 [Mya arenaria]|uniref:putative defense protein 3 n=1 Tax=Mya arenaria TaxID=6604 RepID=UPI0022E6D9D3|nr:putative defense protein 3 [Mya arenaria]
MIRLTLVSLCMVCSTMGFPNGAPDLACKGMKPGHLPTTTSGTNPFMLNISSTTYKPGDTVTGELYGPAGSDGMFKGFLIEVGTQNSVDQEEEAVGEFVSLDSSIQKHVCGNAAITHINNKEKTRVSFSWKAPQETAGTLYFRATVVQKFFPSKYWLGAFSVAITPA